MKFSQIQYYRPDFTKILRDMDEAILKGKNAKGASEQVSALEDFMKGYDEFSTQFAIARIRRLLNTSDEFYKNEQKQFSDNQPLFKLKYKKITKDILNSPYLKEIKEQIGEVAINSYELEDKIISSDIVKDMQEENELVNEYVNLTSKLTVDFDGQIMPLTLLSKYKESPDRQIRKNAYIEEGKAYEKIKDDLDEIFDKLVKNRTRQAKKLGFNNFVELGYARRGRNCYDSSDVKVFKSEVLEHIIPIVNEIFNTRKERLGINDIRYYDLLLPFKNGAPKPQINQEEIIKAAKVMYYEMSDITKSFIDLMLDNELLDVYSKINKAPGGFCTYIKNYEYPFIYANFNGTSGDVYVFTHEMGHALSNYLKSGKEKRSFATQTFDISETHSMAMEFLTSPWHELFFKQETKKYSLMQRENALIFIPYVCQVDEFQEEIYLNPDLTKKQRDELWLKIEEKYRPYFKETELPFYAQGAGWQKQSHIYKTPFYYIEYGLAQVMAMQFFLLFLEDKEMAYKLYFDFLSYGGEKTFTDLIDTLNLTSPLKKGSIKQIAQDFYSKIQEIDV